MINLTGNKPAMKKLFFLLPVLFFIKASTQEPYDFKKFKENDIQKDLLKKYPLKIPSSGKAKGKITLSGPSGTFIFPLEQNMSIDSLQKIMEAIQKFREKQQTGTLVFIQPSGTKVYALPQDQMPCLVPEMSQFNMPVIGKGTKVIGMPPGSAPPNNIIPEK